MTDPFYRWKTEARVKQGIKHVAGEIGRVFKNFMENEYWEQTAWIANFLC